jgi:hypothetical protein
MNELQSIYLVLSILPEPRIICDQVKPSAQPDFVDVYFTVNNGLMYVLYLQPVKPTYAGLGMSFHSMRVAYDNFVYEEIEVK